MGHRAVHLDTYEEISMSDIQAAPEDATAPPSMAPPPPPPLPPTEFEPDTKPKPLGASPSAPPAIASMYQYSTRSGPLVFDAPDTTGHTLQDFMGSDLNLTVEDFENGHGVGRLGANNDPADSEAYKVPHRIAPEQDILETMIEAKMDNHATNVGGIVIPQGQVGFTEKNGEMEVLAPGRRRLWHPQRRMVDVFDFNQTNIKVGNWHFVRVLPGQVGLAVQGGQPVVLEEGRHLLLEPEWRFIGTQNRNDDEVSWPEVPALKIVRVRPGKIAMVYDNGQPRVLQHRMEPYELLRPQCEFVKLGNALDDVVSLDNRSTLDLVRVRPGNIGLAWEDGRPVILPEGLYSLRAPRQQFVKVVDKMQDEIRLDQQNSLDIVRVRPGRLGLIWEHGKPRLLPTRAKPYVLKKPEQQYVRLVKMDEEHVSLGNLHLITVTTGHRGVVWVNGRAKIISEGQWVFNEENFVFGGAADVSTKQYELGPFHFVTVDAGEVGVKHCKGELEVLPAGTHCLRADLGDTFHGFRSVQQEIMKIRALDVITLDNVDLKVDAVLTYTINDPEKALRYVHNLEEVLLNRTEVTLSNIFSHLNYAEKAIPPPKQATNEADRNAGMPSLPSYDEAEGAVRNQVHDEFMTAIQETADKVWGVTIGDLSVDNIHVVNDSLANDLKQRAITSIQVDTQRQNAEAKQRTEILQAETEAQAAKWKAQAKQSSVLAEAEAQAQLQVYAAKAESDAQAVTNAMAIDRAKADAEAVEIRAQGEANARRIELEMDYAMSVAKAKAEAEAELARAEAKKKSIEMEAQALSQLDENAMKLRLWEAQVEMAKAMYANQRTFVDSSSMPTMAQMMNMQALNNMGLLGMSQQAPSTPAPQLEQ